VPREINGLTFPNHFNGRRFYNPEAAQARGFLDVLRWKLTSRPEASSHFISDVEQSILPGHIEGSELRITLANHRGFLHSAEAIDRGVQPPAALPV
jgi:hypothetical protein